MRPPGGGVAQRVVHQVGEHLAHARRDRRRRCVGVGRRRRGRARRGARRPGRPARPSDSRATAATSTSLRRGLPAARLDAATGRAGRPPAAASGGRCSRMVREEPLGGLAARAVAQQRLGVARDRGERRLELVRDVGHEVPADRLEPAHLGEVVQHQHGAAGRAAAARSPGTTRPSISSCRSCTGRPSSTASTTSRAAFTRNSSGRSGSASRGRVAQQPAGGRVGGDDAAPAVGGDHALDHGFDQRRRLGLLPAELVEAVAELPVHLPQRLHQHVDVGNAGAGEAGRGAGGDGPGRRGDVGERPGDRARRRRARARCRRAAPAAPRPRPRPGPGGRSRPPAPGPPPPGPRPDRPARRRT